MQVEYHIRQKILEIVDDPRTNQKDVARQAKIGVTTLWRVTEHGKASRATLRKLYRAFPILLTFQYPN